MGLIEMKFGRGGWCREIVLGQKNDSSPRAEDSPSTGGRGERSSGHTACAFPRCPDAANARTRAVPIFPVPSTATVSFMRDSLLPCILLAVLQNGPFWPQKRF